MNTMKRTSKTGAILLSAVAVFALSGCFNFGGEEGSDVTPSDGVTSVYQTTDFSITIPADWEVIDQNDFTSDVPPETLVVFRNNVKNETFTANVNIVRRELQESVSSLEYANLVNNRQKSGLIDFNETRKETITIPAGDQQDSTYFSAFEARKSTSDSLIRYVQTYGVRGNSAFIITGAFSPQENDVTSQTVENIVRSFQLK